MAAARRREPDPPTQLRGLAAAIERDGCPRAALLRGEERYFRERAIELFVCAAGAAELEVCRHDADDPEFDLTNLLNDLAASPMFASACCVIVRNAGGLLKKTAGGDAPLTRACKALLARDDGSVLVIDARSLRADHALAKAITAGGGPLLSCRKLWETPPPWSPDPRKVELVQWILGRAREVRVRLSADDAVYLAAATGNDLAALDVQLEKLRLGGGRALRELVGWQSGSTPWRVAEDLLAGDAARALAGVEGFFQSGMPSKSGGRRELNPVALSAILLAQVRSLARSSLVVAQAQAAGGSFEDAARAAGVTQPLAVASLRERVRARSAAEWLRIGEEVAALERRVRTAAGVDANDFARAAAAWKLTREPAR
ncbi:MAG: hypothetical protein CMJ84_13215 [Planctomycetes bacterium]|jgi:DNA polymerase III delta subunit|nr:hypothetical protein [Planctomycetota bacterium]MDP6409489.1 hypothetical protein [Planctomycetota bacterium]